MTFLSHLIATAKQSPKKIVVCEADDPRILAAACKAQQTGIATMLLVGNPHAIEQTALSINADISALTIYDPAQAEIKDVLVQELIQLRAAKGMTKEVAEESLNDPLQFAQMLVRCNYADGSVAGAVYSTADVVRSAITLIGKKTGNSLVSSFFIMLLDQPHHPCQRPVIFSDCGLVIAPDANDLTAIALAAADSAKTLLGTEPRIAMLSFSTAGSAKHAAVDKVVQAARQVKAQRPDLAIDEDVQFDAAIIPSIAERKLKNSAVNGNANVFIFPNLDAGNIGYKIAERLGGATAIGPLLQGLNKPANDLSRGCSTDDVYHVIAVTSLQAQGN